MLRWLLVSYADRWTASDDDKVSVLECGTVPRDRVLAIQRNAVDGRQLQVLLWLFQATGGNDMQLLKKAGDVAAGAGDLGIVQWLHEHGAPECFTRGVIDAAAANGHTEIVAFLVVHRSEGHTYLAVYDSLLNKHQAIFEMFRPHGLSNEYTTTQFVSDTARLGRLDVLQLGLPAFAHGQPWAYSRSCFPMRSVFKEVTYLRTAMAEACGLGHLSIVQWLVTQRGFRCDEHHVSRAVRNGHLHILQWVHDHDCGEWGRTGDLDASWNPPNMMEEAAGAGQLEVLQWLHVNRKEGCSSGALSAAAQNGHMEVVRWLLDNFPTHRTSVYTMDEVATGGHLEALQWLLENRTEGCTADAMNNAAIRGFMEVLEWLHANRHEGCTTHAMDGAAAVGRIEVLAWLQKHREEGCSSAAAVRAARSGYPSIAEWLWKHYTSVFDGSRRRRWSSRWKTWRSESAKANLLGPGNVDVVSAPLQFAPCHTLVW